MHNGMRPTTTEKVNSSGTSAQSAAFGANIEYVRVIPDADCHIEFGVNPTATTSSIFWNQKLLNILKFQQVKKLL